MFSKDFKTYSEWKKAHPEDTQYNKRIVNEHKKYPKASLSQLRGHPKGKQKPVSKLKTKKAKKMQVIVSGVEVTNDRNETGSDVYHEFYIRTTRNEEKMAQDINNYLNKNNIKVFPPPHEDEHYQVISFRENVPKNAKVGTQRTAKKDLLKSLKDKLHPAKPKGYFRTNEFKKEKRQKRLDNNEYRKRYDDNEF